MNKFPGKGLVYIPDVFNLIEVGILNIKEVKSILIVFFFYYKRIRLLNNYKSYSYNHQSA